VVSLVATQSVPARFARITSDPFAMDGKRVFAELPTMVDTATVAIGEFLLKLDSNNYYFMRQSQGVLQFGTRVASSDLILLATSYEAGAHRWWQMRVTGGRVFADVSADGVDWTNLESTTADMITGDLSVEFGAGTRANVAEPGQMQVDNVNAGSGLCP
jgi:hypothetical protein